MSEPEAGVIAVRIRNRVIDVGTRRRCYRCQNEAGEL